MNNWPTELKELKRIAQSLSGQLMELESELSQLIEADKDVVLLLYSRRSLEVLVRDICEKEAIKISDTIPLKGIIDKLNKEKKAPSNIITAMLNLNSISTYGAHPKEFDPRQVKSALNDLVTILEWYLNYSSVKFSQIKKIESNKKDLEKNKPAKKNKKLIGIITSIAIVVIVFFLLNNVFNVFHKDEFKELRDREGRISVAVMPFQNLTNDTLWNIWQSGIQNELISKLSNSQELLVKPYEFMHMVLNANNFSNASSITPGLAKEVSKKLEAGTFIFGNIIKSGENFRISAQLINTDTEEVYKTFQLDGKSENDLFHLIDSLSNKIKNFLEISSLRKKDVLSSNDERSTDSVEAYKCYLNGLSYFFETKFQQATQMMEKAVEIDSAFVGARLLLIGYNMGTEKAKYHYKILKKNEEQLNSTERLILALDGSLMDKTPQKSIEITEQLIQQKKNDKFWFQQGYNYLHLHQYDKAAVYFEKTIETAEKFGAFKNYPYIYTNTGYVYHQLGNHQREQEIYEMGLENCPEKTMIKTRQLICALNQQDTSMINQLLPEYKARFISDGYQEYQILYGMANLYMEAALFEKAEINLKKAIELKPDYFRARMKLAEVCFTLDKNIDEGLELLKPIIEKYPDNYSVIYLEGLGLYKKGEFKQAAELFKKSWELRPDYNHDHFELLKDVKHKLGEINE